MSYKGMTYEHARLMRRIRREERERRERATTALLGGIVLTSVPFALYAACRLVSHILAGMVF